jgi:hypothetical protein
LVYKVATNKEKIVLKKQLLKPLPEAALTAVLTAAAGSGCRKRCVSSSKLCDPLGNDPTHLCTELLITPLN